MGKYSKNIFNLNFQYQTYTTKFTIYYAIIKIIKSSKVDVSMFPPPPPPTILKQKFKFSPKNT